MRRLLVALALLAAAAPVTTAVAPSAVAAPSTEVGAFTAHGSVNQVYAYGLGADAGVELLDGDDAVVQTGTTDAQGAYLFRKVPAGTDYQVRRTTDSAVVGDLSVTNPEDNPDDAHYAAEALAHPISSGFGYLTTRDGTQLSVNVTMPNDGSTGPWPVVVEYSGYDPSQPGGPPQEAAVYPYQGYVVVGVNMRGTTCSGGAFDFVEPVQGTDGYDAIETIAHQTWSNGHTGMVGISYSGYSQLYVGATNPPHLDAITPLSPFSDTFSGILDPGGILNDGFALGWATERQDDAKPAAHGWVKQRIANGDTTCAANQVMRLQSSPLLDRIHNTPFIPADHSLDYLNTETLVDKIKMPTFLSSQWQDEQTGGSAANLIPLFDPANKKVFANFTNGTHVEPMGPTELFEVMVFIDLYVGHRIPHTATLLGFGANKVLADLFHSDNVPAFNFPFNTWAQQGTYDKALAYYEAKPHIRVRWENGAVTGWEGLPQATALTRYTAWPVPGTSAEAQYLQPDGSLGAAAPTVADAAARASSSYTYDPTTKRDHTLDGSTDAAWAPHPDVHWNVLTEGNSLSYLSAPYAQKVAYAGNSSVDLWLRSSAADTDLEATLTEVRPDGKEVFIQSGWLRASHRKLDAAKSTVLQPVQTNLEADAAPLPAGQFVPVRIRMFPFAHVIRPGSRLRVNIEAPGGNQDFWAFNTLPGTATDSIGHSAGMPSRIVLPRLPQSAVPNVPATLPACTLEGVTTQAVALRNQPCRTYTPGRIATAVTAAAADDDIDVTWTAPAGTAPDSYVVTASVGAGAPAGATAPDPVTVPGPGTAATFSGVPTRVPLEFTVAAVYATTTAPASDASLPVTVQPYALRAFGSWNAFVTRQLTDFTSKAAAGDVASGVASLTGGLAPEDYIVSVRHGADAVANVDPVTRLYLAYFGRLPDASGVHYWVGKRRAGRTLSWISSSFAASNEFSRKYGSLSNAAFVDRVYQNVLGRPGDPAGRTYWISQLDRHKKSRGHVMLNFSDSTEYRGKAADKVDVANVWIAMLAKAPTAGQLTDALARLAGDTPLATLVDEVLRSSGYHLP
ncbi:MAG: Peptidase [Acidimicrobiales bacterium]|nr:Peptidase [Acidimicrobiales bacterium]